MTEASQSPRTVLITGGSRGLGAAIVGSFLESGDRVATCSRSGSELVQGWEAAHPDRFFHVSLDLTDREGTAAFVRETTDRFGGIDVLINNAGLARDGVLGLFDLDEVDDVIDLNLKGTIHITKLVSRNMLRSGGGRIVNISSIIGLSGYRGLSVYGATKAGLDGFTRALARELGSRNITVNSIAPGYLRTEMTHGLDGGQMDQIARRTPLGRLGEPGDVTGAIQFLVSDAAAFITGTTVVIDGGLTT